MTSEDPRLTILNRAYRACSTDHVAYLDETYETAAGSPTARTFYVMAAYITLRADLPIIRTDLVQIANGHYWHSTQANQTSEGRDRLLRMCEYIAAAPESDTVIITVKSPIDSDDSTGERARALAIEKLLGELHTNPELPDVSLVVAERRNTEKLVSMDMTTIRRLRKAGVLGNTQVLWTSPATEHTLWLPDVIAYAHYREWSVGDGAFLTKFDARVRRFRA